MVCSFQVYRKGTSFGIWGRLPLHPQAPPRYHGCSDTSSLPEDKLNLSSTQQLGVRARHQIALIWSIKDTRRRVCDITTVYLSSYVIRSSMQVLKWTITNCGYSTISSLVKWKLESSFTPTPDNTEFLKKKVNGISWSASELVPLPWVHRPFQANVQMTKLLAA